MRHHNHAGNTEALHGKEYFLRVDKRSLLLHFFGADGAGKTTQAKLLFFRLRQSGVKAKLVRIRSGRTLASILYRLFVRLDSNLTEIGGDGRVIRIKFIRNKFDRQIWSWIEFLSMIPWLLRGIFIPLLLGKTVVAERYIIDAIATIAYIIDDPDWSESFLARLMLHFIPKNSILIHIDAPYTTIQRRKGSYVDPLEYIEFQRRTYFAFAKRMNAITIDTSVLSKEETHNAICKHLRITRTMI